jgi:type I restriction enzyme S subunit
MKLKPYPQYKDSGVEWIGKIPEGWKVNKIKEVNSVRISNVDKKSKSYESNVLLCNYTDVYNNEFITSEFNFMKATANLEQIKKLSLIKGDVIITKDSESPNDIAVPALVNENLDNVVCGYHLALIRPNQKKITGNFLFRILKSKKINDQFVVAANGVTRFGISTYPVKNSYLTIPTFDEQVKITNFLDKKISEINKTIEKDNELIKLLNEKRTSLINHVVTKGLNQNAKMKDSGIKWIGEIPYHWKIKRLKYLSDLIPGQSPNEKTYNEEGRGAILINGPNEYSKSDFGYTRSIKWTTDPKKWAPKDSLLFCLRGSTTGRLNIAHSKISIGRGVASIVAKNNQRFLNYVMIILRPYVLGNSRGSTFPSVTSDDLGNYSVPDTSLIEQQEIVNYLDKQTAKIDKTCQKIGKKIKLLDEYKKSLILQVVTGKVDVSEVVL